MDTLDSLKKREAFFLAELLRALNCEVLYKYPELGEAYEKYMAAVAETQKSCYARVAATLDNAE